MSKAILAGSGMLAAAIVVAALVIPDAAAEPVQAAKSSGDKAVTAPRYEIIKIQNGTSWTLDRKTGVITICKVRDEHMVLSFPPKTGPLFIETEGGWDGSVSTVGDAQSREGECAVEEECRGARTGQADPQGKLSYL